MHTTRKRILELLKEGGPATVSQLADALEMVPVSVRHHLDVLQGEDLICVERVQRKGEVGRPKQLYALTHAAKTFFPDNFALLAAGLMQQMKEMLPQAQVESSFCAMARQIAAELPIDGLAGSSLSERLVQVEAFLNDRGYLARWEESAVGDGEGFSSGEQIFFLHTHNCPYASVSAQHGELCLMDQVMMSELMGQPCERVDSLAHGGNSCTYRIVQSGS